MTSMEQRIQELEFRPATFDSAEQTRRISMFQTLSAINRFEGILPSATDERLYGLLASGRIDKNEYLALCLTDAHDAT